MQLQPLRRALTASVLASAAIFWLGDSPARAELPAAADLLKELGLSPNDVSQVESGVLVHHSVPAASERELTAGLAFEVKSTPSQLIAQSKRDLLDRVDPNTLSYGVIQGAGSLADFAKLTLEPDSSKRARAYVEAEAGSDLNLSADEIAAFRKLGGSATTEQVTDQVRKALLARVQAYQKSGLAGIAPYARGGSDQRSPGGELKIATEASVRLKQYVPGAYQFLLSYPNGRPAGTQEVFRWSQIDAHGTPTIVLSQVLQIPDGDGWIVVQRQFYVSAGYNSEQAVAAILPAKSGGSVVLYANHTSTDQVTGFGGSAKRSIGSKLLASQLEELYERGRAAVK